MWDDDDGSGKEQRRTCVDCGAIAPPTSTGYTLISAKHGWRLTRRLGKDNSFHADWRCPACWRVYKDREGIPASRPKPSR